MYEQLDIFRFLAPQRTFSPGEYVEKEVLGKQLTFDEITEEVGKLIILDKSTESHEWFEIVMVERIIVMDNNQRRLVYYDGGRQRGLVNEMYFDEDCPYTRKAYLISDEQTGRFA